MKKAVVFYQSKTGTTEKYAKEIGNFLLEQQIDTQIYPVNQYHEDLTRDVDFLFLGCWTKGLMVLFQKPDEVWKDFAGKISVPEKTKISLFATYKILTGSMFRNMEKSLNGLYRTGLPRFKSRDGELSVEYKSKLESMLS
jgi:flavodoxin